MSSNVSPPTIPRAHVTYRNRIRIHCLRHDADWSLSRIGLHLGIPVSTVARLACSPTTPTTTRHRQCIINTPRCLRLIGVLTSSSENRRMTYAQLGQTAEVPASA